MNAQNRRTALLRDSAGYTLVETIVTTALVVTVLVPLGSMAIYLLTVKRNAPEITALAIGQRLMEETLHAQSYASRTIELDAGRWRAEKSVSWTGRQIIIVIRVFRRHRPRPLVELMTVRLAS